MNQSAVYRVSKRELDEAEEDFPVKRPCLHPTAARRLVCRFVRRSNSPVNNPPVVLPNSPVNKPSVIAVASPVEKLPVVVPKSPVNEPPPVIVRHGDGSETWTVFRREEASEGSEPIFKESTFVLTFETSMNGRAAALNKRMLHAFSPENIPENIPENLPANYRAEESAEAEKRGYTAREFELCRGYLFKRGFEKSPEEPLPRNLRQLKRYLDQIRDTRGYGLTLNPPLEFTAPMICANLLCRMLRYKQKDPWVLEYVKRMEGMVLGEIREKMGKTYQCAGLVNLVECHFIRLCTFHVHEEGAAPTTDGQPREIAEARFLMRPIYPILERIVLEEWKIRKGEEVLFSTVEINGGNPRA